MVVIDTIVYKKTMSHSVLVAITGQLDGHIK